MKRSFIPGLLLKVTGFLVLYLPFVFAGDYYSNSNKSLFVFPGHTALGGAALVFTRDAAPLSNPANLSLDSSSVLCLAYTGLYENAISTTLSSFTTRINENIGVGMSVAYLYVPEIVMTDKLEVDEDTQDPIWDPSLIYIKTSSEFFMNFSFGYSLIKTNRIRASVGASVHCQRRRLIDWTGYGIGVDAGATIVLRKPGIRFSLFFDDITTNYIRWSSDYHDNGLPHARVGIGWRKEFPYIYGKISVMYKSPDLFSNEGVGYNLLSEKNEKITEPEKYNIKEKPVLLFTYGAYGFEYVIHKMVALRLGFDEPKRTSFGGGVNLFDQTLSFDFAYLVPYDLPGSYSLSISYRW